MTQPPARHRPRPFRSSAARVACVACAIGAAWAVSAANAQDPVVWAIEQSLTRQDTSVLWTSPTAIGTDFLGYEFDYDVTNVSARFGGAINPVDIGALVGEAYDPVGPGSVGAAPVTLFDGAVDDVATGTTLDLRLELGDDGLGRVTWSNIALGQIATDFGTRFVDIDELLIEATLTVTGVDDLPGDFDGNDIVNGADYSLWQLSYGSELVLLADGNGDGVVNAADYTIWRDNLPVPPPAGGVPEPAAWLLSLVAMACRPRRAASRTPAPPTTANPPRG